MMTFISFSFSILAIFLAIPVAVFLIEVLASVRLPLNNVAIPPRADNGPRIAVLVPAHNEGSALLPTINDIRDQLRPTDRLLVIADNCVDDTAAVVTKAGVEVVVRSDPARRGKGFALAFGLSSLASDPPDIVIMFDSDCRLADGAVSHLATACTKLNRPVQALYLMTAPSGTPINYRVAEFAWRIKNWVRPLGLLALGLPCQMMGTGMAFRWEMLSSINLASDSIVEDLKLGVDLALAGYAPIFSPNLSVTSSFPTSGEGRRNQRLRWERGHLRMIFSATPRLLFLGIVGRKLDLCAIALDLAVPPLSLLGLLSTMMLFVSGLAACFGVSSAAFALSAVTFTGLLLGVYTGWVRIGRDILPSTEILRIASYIVEKLPLYGRLFSGRSSAQWIRTDRE